MAQCPSCKNRIRPDDIYCENCGQKLQSEPQQKTWFQLPAGIGSWRTLKWVTGLGGIAVLLLCTLCGASFTYLLQSPESLLVEVPVTRVVTATPTLTPTNTPGPSPTPTATFTATPTHTPTPTFTPIPDTPPGSVLQIGQTWRQSDMTMRVERFVIEEFECGDIWWEGDFWSKWQVVIENQTDQDLIVNIDDNDFLFGDNQGDQAPFLITTNGKCVKEKVKHSFGKRIPLNVQILKAREELRLWGWGLGRIEDRQWFHFGVTKAGRIENAKWQFDIPR